jgi:hypothetical protein
MLTSIVRREGFYSALCDDCGLPIERLEAGRWAAAAPLAARANQPLPRAAPNPAKPLVGMHPQRIVAPLKSFTANTL